MQCACVEFARNVLGYEEASSAEMNPDTPHPIIDLMEDQVNLKQMGGTMRLGAYSCTLSADSKLISAYQNDEISERHRHRYEFNNRYIELFEQHGMIAAGINPEKNLVEIVELKEHPWYIGTQFHPELKSTVMNPHPIFVSFVGAVLANSKKF